MAVVLTAAALSPVLDAQQKFQDGLYRKAIKSKEAKNAPAVKPAKTDSLVKATRARTLPMDSLALAHATLPDSLVLPDFAVVGRDTSPVTFYNPYDWYYNPWYYSPYDVRFSGYWYGSPWYRPYAWGNPWYGPGIYYDPWYYDPYWSYAGFYSPYSWYGYYGYGSYWYGPTWYGPYPYCRGYYGWYDPWRYDPHGPGHIDIGHEHGRVYHGSRSSAFSGGTGGPVSSTPRTSASSASSTSYRHPEASRSTSRSSMLPRRRVAKSRRHISTTSSTSTATVLPEAESMESSASCSLPATFSASERRSRPRPCSP